MKTFTLLVLAGDGIGVEVTESALEILTCITSGTDIQLKIEHDLAGGICFQKHGVFIRDETVKRALAVDAILFGAEGGPQWDQLDVPGGPCAKSGLSRLRKELDLFANIRPARYWPETLSCLPFREAIVSEVDIIIVRELVSGIYFGEPRGIETINGERVGIDTNRYTESEISRVAKSSFEIARKRRRKLCSVDKANVMESGVLWRDVVSKLGREHYPDIELSHLYADACLYELVTKPDQFDVIVADNLFGDLLSDTAAAFTGSLGMLPSASFGPFNLQGRRPALYEPVHGSAPDIAGKNIANPAAAILSIAMMLEFSLDRSDLALSIETAIARVIRESGGAIDLGGSMTTQDFTKLVGASIVESLA